MSPLWISVALMYAVMQSMFHVAIERWQWRQLQEACNAASEGVTAVAGEVDADGRLS